MFADDRISRIFAVSKTIGLCHPIEAGGIDTPRTLTKLNIKIKMNIDILNLSKQWPELNITVRAKDLTEMVKFCVLETKQQIEQTLADASAETYLSPKETAELLDVDPSTLFRWNKRNYLNHIELGGLRKYRRSDINKILEGK